MPVNYIVEYNPVEVDPNSFWNEADVGGGPGPPPYTAESYAPFADQYTFTQDGVADGALTPLRFIIKPADPLAYYVAAGDFTVRGQEPTYQIGGYNVNNQIYWREWDVADSAQIHPSISKIWIYDFFNPTYSSQGWGATNEVHVWAWVDPNFQIFTQDVQFVLDIDGDAKPVVPTDKACFDVIVETEENSNIDVHVVLPQWWDANCMGCTGYSGINQTFETSYGWKWEVLESGDSIGKIRACIHYPHDQSYYEIAYDNNYLQNAITGQTEYFIAPKMFVKPNQGPGSSVFEWGEPRNRAEGLGLYHAADPMRWFILKPKSGYALSRNNLSIAKQGGGFIGYGGDGSWSAATDGVSGGELTSPMPLAYENPCNSCDDCLGLTGVDDISVGDQGVEEAGVFPPYITSAHEWCENYYDNPFQYVGSPDYDGYAPATYWIFGEDGTATGMWDWDGTYLPHTNDLPSDSITGNTGLYKVNLHAFPQGQVRGGNYGSVDEPWINKSLNEVFVNPPSIPGSSNISPNLRKSLQLGFIDTKQSLPQYYCGIIGDQEIPTYTDPIYGYECESYLNPENTPCFDDIEYFQNGQLLSWLSASDWIGNNVILQIPGWQEYDPLPAFNFVTGTTFQGDEDQVSEGILSLPNLKFNILGSAMYVDNNEDENLEFEGTLEID